MAVKLSAIAGGGFISGAFNNEAFYAYIDKINAEGNRVTHPPLKSLEDMENYPEFLEKLRGNRPNQESA